MTDGFWTRPRVLAVTLAATVLAVFAAANAHLIVIAFATHPECALQVAQGDAATFRAAAPSC